MSSTFLKLVDLFLCVVFLHWITEKLENLENLGNPGESGGILGNPGGNMRNETQNLSCDRCD